jgi:bifunctional non-homologous end joining protein LigD
VTLGFPVLPMKASLGRLPIGDGWAFEVKWDGYRTIAHVDGADVRLQSTAGHDVSARWPELGALAPAVNASRAIVDGELVVLDDDGIPRFELVQQHQGPGTTRREAALYLFDVLSIDGTDTIGLPYEDRRRLLEGLIEPGDNWLVPSSRVGDGEALLEATREQGLEGVVAKRLGSTYRPGTRTRDWVKVKHRRPLDVVIGGYTAGSGTRAGTFGALLVGLPTDGELRFAGGVGTGFSHAVLEDLADRLRPLRTSTCPFTPAPPASEARGATWVEPVLGATVEIAELTNDGLVRQASFVRLLDR